MFFAIAINRQYETSGQIKDQQKQKDQRSTYMILCALEILLDLLEAVVVLVVDAGRDQLQIIYLIYVN